MRSDTSLNRNTLLLIFLCSSFAVTGCGGGDNAGGVSSSANELSSSDEMDKKHALRRRIRPAPAPDPALTPAPAPVLTGSATLAWTAAADARVVGYRVYYGPSPGSYLQAAGSGVYTTSTSGFTASGLNSGTTYYFAVTSVTGVPGEESTYSNEASKLIP